LPYTFAALLFISNSKAAFFIPAIFRNRLQKSKNLRIFTIQIYFFMKTSYIPAALFSIFLFFSTAAMGQVRLPQLVSDGMVLQRDSKIKIWGWAAPGEAVKIKFDGKKFAAKTGADSSWAFTLPALPAGGPYQMEISAANHIVIHDILIGDVWFCSGQSNMVLPMERVKEKYPDEIATANYPQIRNFFIPTLSDVSRVHEDLPPGKWMAATPSSVLNFGAATYFFAKQLYLKYHIPIGIINSSVGGTPIQAWISEQGIHNIPQYADRLTVLKDTAYLNSLVRKTLGRHRMDNAQTKTADEGLTGRLKWYDTAFVPANWHKFWLPGYWADQGVHGLNGVVWFRKEIDIPASMAGKPAKLFMGRIVDADQTYVNGVLVGNITYQYPPRRYQVPANLLKPGKNIIVVRVTNTAGKGGFVPDKPYYITNGAQKIDLRGDWTYQVGEVFAPPVEMGPDYNFSAQNEPTGLYNTMVAPAVNYAIKGILWYQGEANTNRPDEYGQLLTALIADWRDKWHDANIPFIYAQLPGFMEVNYSPSESKWAKLREEQLKTLSTPNTEMAVTIDAGEWNDIHPLDKKDVGDRMALLADKLAYHDTNLVASGPVYQSAQIQGDKIIVTFTETGSGLVAKGGELTQFAIAGETGKYVWANATIEGDKVIVWSEKVPHPLYVRYAWADNPDGANLYNKEGLPASPFTTDSR
jgi:sialate O-acetylesterase